MPKQKSSKEKTTSLIPQERIAHKIFLIRGRKVMLDRDLAELYGVETKAFNRAVKRNIDRFPDDFMFQLSKEEFANLRCQIGTSSWGGRRYPPYVFTEQGVAMLSSVLNSKRAIMVNIQIMRVFTKMREMLLTHTEFKKEIEDLERKMEEKFKDHDEQLKIVFEALRQLLEPPEKRVEEIGFRDE